jgi:hypothetical protein
MDLEDVIGAGADMAPGPADLEGMAGTVGAEAPSPFGGPGDVTAGSVEAESASMEAPAPMSMSDLEKLEAG